MANRESVYKSKILIKLGRVLNGLFWNNPTGLGVPDSAVRELCKRYNLMDEYYRLPKIAYGLPGSSDIIGISSVEVTPDMIGSHLGVATFVEVKTETGRQRENQKTFQRNVERVHARYFLTTDGENVLSEMRLK